MTLYHYCTLETFLAVMKSKSLWISSLRHMNDPAEIDLGMAIVSRAVETVFPEVAETIDWNESQDNHYLCGSFSLDGDVLSQWRAYAADGSGIAVGLDRDALSSCNAHDDFEGLRVPHSHSIDTVYYDGDEFFEATCDSLRQFKTKYGIPSHDHPDPHAKLGKFSHGLFRRACHFKDAFYREEKEVRYIVPINPCFAARPVTHEHWMDFRVSSSGLTPYSRLNLCKGDTHAVTEVILGPKNQSRLSDVVLFLQLNGYSGATVYKSQGAYR